MKCKKTWIVIADGARARVILNTGPGKGLKPAFSHEFAASHVPTRAIGSDKPGRSFESADGSRHAMEPSVDWHDREKILFIKDVAKVLDKAARDKSFDRLILVAPPEVLGSLRNALKPATRDMVSAELGKDITHVPITKLPGHLSGLLVV